MNIVFVSNYFNHHQYSLSENFYHITGGEYTFIATGKMRNERKALGYKEETPEYVMKSYINEQTYEQCLKIINEADVVIAGSCPERMIQKRIRENKLTFRYSERPLKNKQHKWKYIWNFIKFNIKNPRNKNLYMLCASAYTAADYAKFCLYNNKAFKWGYFPSVLKYDIEDLCRKKEKRSIVWVGRMVNWKHPDDVIEVAKRLKEEQESFRLYMIGIGEMEQEIRNKVDLYGLSEQVILTGAMSPENVRKYMENSEIFLFTSDFQEGWGAVLNEAMNSGCAVIASHSCGSVPYLIENEKNGYIYQFGKNEQLYINLKRLLNNPEECRNIGMESYKTIINEWNAEIAAKRFCELVENIDSGKKEILYDHGPCSKALILKDNWFKGEY